MVSGRATWGLTTILAACLASFWSIKVIAADASPIVRSVNFEQIEDRVDLSLTLDRQVPFLAYSLDRPRRLIVDFPAMRWTGTPLDTASASPFIVAAHSLKVSSGKSRLVLRLDRPFAIAGQSGKSQDSADGFKIVISLRPEPPLERQHADSLIDTVARHDPKDLTLSPKIKPTDEIALATPQPHMIVLDPGHGGVDPGAVSAGGVQEKNIVLSFAKELRNLFNQDARYQVVLTRKDDSFVRLRQRLRLAKQVGADLFLSLHADSLRKSNFRGASVYTLSSTASDDEAARLAAEENKADILSDTDLSPYDDIVTNFLIDLVRRDTYNKSIVFAEILVEELGEVTRLVKQNRRFAGFVVLKSPETPSVLLEMGYLSNPDDARDLQNAERRAAMAQAVKTAIDRYFDGQIRSAGQQ